MAGSTSYIGNICCDAAEGLESIAYATSVDTYQSNEWLAGSFLDLLVEDLTPGTLYRLHVSESEIQ